MQTVCVLNKLAFYCAIKSPLDSLETLRFLSPSTTRLLTSQNQRTINDSKLIELILIEIAKLLDDLLSSLLGEILSLSEILVKITSKFRQKAFVC